MADEFYAIKINNVYWLGTEGMVQTPVGIGMKVGPTRQNLIFIPADANDEEKEQFKSLAEQNGGQIMLLRAYGKKEEYIDDQIQYLLDNISAENDAKRQPNPKNN